MDGLVRVITVNIIGVKLNEYQNLKEITRRIFKHSRIQEIYRSDNDKFCNGDI